MDTNEVHLSSVQFQPNLKRYFIKIDLEIFADFVRPHEFMERKGSQLNPSLGRVTSNPKSRENGGKPYARPRCLGYSKQK